MRVERGQHAVDGRLDQRRLIGLLDIVRPDALEHVAEQVELTVGVDAGGHGRPEAGKTVFEGQGGDAGTDNGARCE